MNQTFTGSIYLIVNLSNNKKYVGQTIKPIRQRFRDHCESSSKCPKLRNAIQKYGKENFKIITLKVFACSDFETLHKQLDYWETWYIEYYHSVEQGYNCTYGGQNTKVYSEETKKKIRESVIQMYKDHPEYKTRIGNQHRGMKLPTIWKPVIQMDMNGNFIKEWPSITAATKSFGLKYSHISNVCSGKRQSTLGYKWKYKI